MRLSPHFTLTELTKSQIAERRGIENIPDDEAIENLSRVCHGILEPVRSHFGVPFSPSSGFRCRALNRVLGSKDTSQHIRGQAVDFDVPGTSNPALARWIQMTLDYDQLILEFYRPGVPGSGWVHCSVKAAANRRVALTIGRDGARQGLHI